MPVQKSGRRFQSEHQRRLLYRNAPDVAEKWTREEEEAGISSHRHPVQKLHPDRKINPETGKEEQVATDTRGSTRRVGNNRVARSSNTRTRTGSSRGGRFADMTREELRDRAKGSGIKGWYRMGSDELRRALSGSRSTSTRSTSARSRTRTTTRR